MGVGGGWGEGEDLGAGDFGEGGGGGLEAEGWVDRGGEVGMGNGVVVEEGGGMGGGMEGIAMGW